MQQVAADHDTRTALASLAVHSGHAAWVLCQEAVHMLAECLDLAQSGHLAWRHRACQAIVFILRDRLRAKML